MLDNFLHELDTLEHSQYTNKMGTLNKKFQFLRTSKHNNDTQSEYNHKINPHSFFKLF